MTVTLALLGDTMLGRGVGDALCRDPAWPLVDGSVREVLRDATLVVANLECCISDRGEPWPAPGKPFHFRAPPVAAERLAELGVTCVTLANNHALDYGEQALLDTFRHLSAAGVAWVGAGTSADEARAPAELVAGGLSVGVVGATDHPADFAATATRPGVAYAALERGVPGWLVEVTRQVAASADVALVSPHWGPNMTSRPVPHVRRAAAALAAAGATLVAGHSAHVFHGVAGNVLYDIGDFVDDYATDQRLRNDLGLLWVVELAAGGARRVEAVPLHIGFRHTSVASGDDARWVTRRLVHACESFGTAVRRDAGHLVIDLPAVA